MIRLFQLLLGASPLSLARQQLFEAEREHIKHTAAAEEHHAAAVMYEERARRLHQMLDKAASEHEALLKRRSASAEAYQ